MLGSLPESVWRLMVGGAFRCEVVERLLVLEMKSNMQQAASKIQLNSVDVLLA
jgi:hypothetical protein